MGSAPSAMAQAEDGELAALAAAGDAVAFGVLAGRYQGLMHGVCRRITCTGCGACVSFCPIEGAIVDRWVPDLQEPHAS
jgi:ferredoxin